MVFGAHFGHFGSHVEHTNEPNLRRSAANFGIGLKSFNVLYIGLVLHTLSLKAIDMVS